MTDAATDPATDPAGVPGYHDDRSAVLARLRRIEGQVRGVQRMVADDTYCIDVLTQVSAINRALQSVAVLLLDDHLRHCVTTAIRSGDPSEADRIISEATRTVERLVRS